MKLKIEILGKYLFYKFKEKIMEKFVDENLAKISSAGDFLGRGLRKVFKNTSKGFIVVGILTVCGLAVFIWGVIDGARKKK